MTLCYLLWKLLNEKNSKKLNKKIESKAKIYQIVPDAYSHLKLQETEQGLG